MMCLPRPGRPVAPTSSKQPTPHTGMVRYLTLSRHSRFRTARDFAAGDFPPRLHADAEKSKNRPGARPMRTFAAAVPSGKEPHASASPSSPFRRLAQRVAPEQEAVFRVKIDLTSCYRPTLRALPTPL